MIDAKQLEQLVRDQVATAVNADIAGLLDDTNWLNAVEESIVEYAQQRVVAKFNNAESMQEILSTVQDSVKRLFENGQIDQIKDLVAPDELQRVINQELGNNIKQHVQTLFKDNDFLIGIKRQLVSTLQSEIKKNVNAFNIRDEVKDLVSSMFFDFAKTIEFNGINDTAETTELSVMPGIVVAENDFVAKNIQAIETLKTTDLIVNGGIAGSGARALEDAIKENVFNMVMDESKDALTESVIERSKAGIDFNAVSINGTPLIENGTLNSHVKLTSITKVGTLNQLHVAGEALIHDTAYIGNKRVGINTQEPAMSLDLWDEEVQVSIGKKKERTGFIGSHRLQNLEIGVNGRGNITITDKNIVVVENLQIDKNRISWESSLPGYSGGKGDVVFNTNVGPNNTVFAWMCAGGYNWVALSASVS